MHGYARLCTSRLISGIYHIGGLSSIPDDSNNIIGYVLWLPRIFLNKEVMKTPLRLATKHRKLSYSLIMSDTLDTGRL